MVSAIDFWIGKFLKTIDLTNTLVVITADHGEYIRSLKINNEIINLESGTGEKALWKIGNKIQARYYWSYVLNLEDTEKDLKDNIKNKLILGL